MTQKDAALADKAKAVTAQMDTMIKTVRRIATELRPGMLDDLGLAASIEWLARDFEKRTGGVMDAVGVAEGSTVCVASVVGIGQMGLCLRRQ